MARNLLVAAILAIVVGVPFLFQPDHSLLVPADDTLVIVSPNNEAIRHEFARAFAEHWKKKSGRIVRIDWRTPGGTSEIARYLAAEYLAAFQYHWTKSRGGDWNSEVQGAFDNRKIVPDESPDDDTPAESARREFLESEIGCGIDLFFGGGAYDFAVQAAAGRLIDSGILRAEPGWFGDGPGRIPRSLGGEEYWDADGRWVGTCLSSFGICYNLDSLDRLGLKSPPVQWADLADPLLAGQVALADPTKSGSVAKAFEMLIQQRIQQNIRRQSRPGIGSPAVNPLNDGAVAAGWSKAMQLIIQISANARYFTDSGTKIPIDVALGDAAAGMCIDFYGRYESEAQRASSGRSHMLFLTPDGGSSVGADPIGLLRGSPHPALAREFIHFVLSLDGQKLWNFKVGAPGGPETYALRRLPIRAALYGAEFREFRSDPEVDAYREADNFTYHPEWTASLFGVIRFVIRVACLDAHEELRRAWSDIRAAGMPDAAMARLLDVSAIDYAAACGPIREALGAADRLEEVRLARELADRFRRQYREAGAIARGEGPE